MLRLLFTNGKEIAWHDTMSPIRDIMETHKVSFQDLIEVEADGEELESIKLLGNNSIPIFDTSQIKVQSWYGDMARFIAGNLLSQEEKNVLNMGLTLDQLNSIYIIKVLESTKNNQKKASEILGVDTATLFRWRQKNLLMKNEPKS